MDAGKGSDTFFELRIILWREKCVCMYIGLVWFAIYVFSGLWAMSYRFFFSFLLVIYVSTTGFCERIEGMRLPGKKMCPMKYRHDNVAVLG